jgi:hypothetical protein
MVFGLVFPADTWGFGESLFDFGWFNPQIGNEIAKSILVERRILVCP